MTPLEQVKILSDALQKIGEIAVPDESDPMPALVAAQNIAEDARRNAGLLHAEEWTLTESPPRHWRVERTAKG